MKIDVSYNGFMTVRAKSVSRRYAINEFKTVGLVLIIYCLFVLYVPIALKEALPLIGLSEFLGFDVYLLSSLACLILGTLIPFIMLRVRSGKKLADFNQPVDMNITDYLVHYVVFFALSTAAIFATMMAAQYINVSGQLVSSIGITINSEYMANAIYAAAFILISPVLEEYAFRGSLLNCLSRYGKYFATIASSLIYALAHGSFVEMIPSFIMGYMLCKISLYHKSIRPCIIIHILFNLSLYALFMVPERYSLYMMAVLALMIILAVVLLTTRVYRVVKIRKYGANRQVGMMFLTTVSVFIALILFVTHSLLMIVL